MFELKKLKPVERYLLHHADNGLIMNHRLCEWCGQAPELEIEMGIANIGLDHLGQARLWLQVLIQHLKKKNIDLTEDEIAYLRDDREYTNYLICEQPNGDYAMTVGKLFFYSEFHRLILKKLEGCSNPDVANVAVKAGLETGYHNKFFRHWMAVLGEGTDESRSRLAAAVSYLWPYCGEFFRPAEFEKEFFKEDDPWAQLKEEWLAAVTPYLKPLGLSLDESLAFYLPAGKDAHHSEYLSYLLGEFQSLHRRYQGVTW